MQNEQSAYAMWQNDNTDFRCLSPKKLRESAGVTDDVLERSTQCTKGLSSAERRASFETNVSDHPADTSRQYDSEPTDTDTKSDLFSKLYEVALMPLCLLE